MSKKIANKEQLQISYEDQNVVNALLRLGLEDIPLKQILHKALHIILSVSWLPKQAPAGIYLTEKDQVLKLLVSKNICSDYVKSNNKVFFGSGSCGKVAQSKSLEFLALDGCGSTIAGIPNNSLSQYATPIIRGDAVLGVIFIHLKTNHKNNKHEAHLLQVIADTLAGIIEHSKAYEALIHSQSNLAKAQQIAHMGSWEWDMLSHELYCSAEAYDIFDLPIIKKPSSYGIFLDKVHPDDRLKVIQAVRETLRKREPYRVEHRILTKEKEERILFQQGEMSFTKEGHISRITGTVRDITQQRQTEREMRLANNVFEGLQEGIMVTDTSGHIIRVNKAFESITGYTENEVLNKTPRFLHSGYHSTQFYEAMWQEIMEYQIWRGEVWNKRINGDIYPQSMTISAVKNSLGEVVQYVAILNDITEKKTSEKRIYQLAHYDVLTQLPNRALFQERLAEQLRLAKKNKQQLAVMFLDLDGFKHINDSMGHQLGDRLLEVVANRLQGCIRSSDTVSRWGGDEFTLILSNLQHKDDASHIADTILSTLSEPLMLNGNELVISASIGISFYPADGYTPVTLVQNADMAMYRAKENGRNHAQFFTAEMNAAAMERLQLENGLRKALEREEFELYYQPLPDLNTGLISGAEALIRWNHPENGIVSPDKFIPIAEDSGLIIPMGIWVLETACRQCKEWQRLGLEDLKISVNISARQFRDPNIFSVIRNTLKTTGLDAHYLTLELTESSIMDNAEETIFSLKKLKNIGVSLSIDDFGTGYSSLSYLKRFPIDTLKIDRSFVTDIATDEDDKAIVKSIIAMAHSLHLSVVAEGVETYEHIEFLQEQNCDFIQGYYFSRPLPVKNFSEFALHWRDWGCDNGNILTSARAV